MTRKLNVILSGGHFLGVILHAGAVAELHRQCQANDWTIANIGGLSAGAMIAAAYASGHDDPGLRQIVTEHMIASGAARRGMPIAEADYLALGARLIDGDERGWPALYRTNRIQRTVGVCAASRLKGMHQARFRCVAANVSNRNSIAPVKRVFDSVDDGGLVTRAVVLASMAIPLGFPLVEIGGNVYCDGALAVGNTPYDLWRDIDPRGADTVILRIQRPLRKASPSKRVFGLAQDAIETALAALDRLSLERKPPLAKAIDIPATGPGDCFDIDEADAIVKFDGAAAVVASQVPWLQRQAVMGCPVCIGIGKCDVCK